MIWRNAKNEMLPATQGWYSSQPFRISGKSCNCWCYSFRRWDAFAEYSSCKGRLDRVVIYRGYLIKKKCLPSSLFLFASALVSSSLTVEFPGCFQDQWHLYLNFVTNYCVFIPLPLCTYRYVSSVQPFTSGVISSHWCFGDTSSDTSSTYTLISYLKVL